MTAVTVWTYTAADLAATDQLGAALADVLPEPACVALCGTLGAGKTRLVQALAAALGVDRQDVVSPTFVLCQSYAGRRPLHHFDAYRLRGDDEFLDLGPEEYCRGRDIAVIEWADRVANCLPDDYLRIDVEPVGETSRRFAWSAVGAGYAPVAAALAARLAAAATTSASQDPSSCDSR